MPFIASVASSLPPVSLSQTRVRELMEEHYRTILKPRSLDALSKMLSHESIETRHFAFDTDSDLVKLKGEDQDCRMDRFLRWAVRLAKEAAQKSIDRAGVTPADIDAVFVNTCTGYVCPGISTYLIGELGLRRDIQCVDLVGSGCGGAVPCIAAASDSVSSNGYKTALAISVEISSATFEMGDDMSLLVSNCIFGDGAAAVLVSAEKGLLKIDKRESSFIPENRDDVRFIYKNGRLHNRLAVALPKIVGEVVPPLVYRLLDKAGMAKRDIAHWAIHPGGAKMLDELQRNLELSGTDLIPAREVLRCCGNMSSPTALFELEKTLYENGGLHGNVALIAYGAGMSVHGLILKKSISSETESCFSPR